jgi:hypothetical protein
MYRDTPAPHDQPTDAMMTALYRQLDDHELTDDAGFDARAGLQQLADRIRRESIVPADAAGTPAAPRPETLPGRRRAAEGRRGRPPQHRAPAPNRYPRPHPAAAVTAAALLLIVIGTAVFRLAPSPGPRPPAQPVPAARLLAVLQLGPGQAQMSPAEKTDLASKISTIREAPATRIKVTSYTGGPAAPAGLADQRAQNVFRFLKEQGISASMIRVQTVHGPPPSQGTGNAGTVVVTWSNPPAVPSQAPGTTSTGDPAAAASPTATVSPTPTGTPAATASPTAPAPSASSPPTASPSSPPATATATPAAPASPTSPSAAPGAPHAPGTDP